MRMPMIARGKGCHARRTLEIYEQRKRCNKLTPMQQAYIEMHAALHEIKNSPAWDSLDTVLQDTITSA